VPQSDKTGSDPDYIGFAVSVAPVTEQQWSLFRDYYEVKKNRQSYCFTDTGFFCAADIFAGDAWWIEVQATGMDTVSAKALTKTFNGVVDGLVASVTGATESGTPWSAPEGTIALGGCDSILSPKAASTAIGGAPVEILNPEGGVSLDSTARTELEALWCLYPITDTDDAVGTLTWLPGGEWAWNEASQFDLPGGEPTPLDVAGLIADDGDGAWTRCSGDTCEVDLVVGHNWINFSLASSNSGGANEGAPVLEKIAASIVSAVRS